MKSLIKGEGSKNCVNRYFQVLKSKPDNYVHYEHFVGANLDKIGIRDMEGHVLCTVNATYYNIFKRVLTYVDDFSNYYACKLVLSEKYKDCTNFPYAELVREIKNTQNKIMSSIFPTKKAIDSVLGKFELPRIH